MSGKCNVIVVTRSAYDTDRGKLYDSREQINNVFTNGGCGESPRHINIVNVSFSHTYISSVLKGSLQRPGYAFFSVCNKDFKVVHSSIDGCKKGLINSFGPRRNT